MIRAKRLVSFLVVAGMVACIGRGAARAERVHEPIVGLPCEGCEAVFSGLPDSIAWTSRIAPPAEPGTVLHIEGVVRDAGGQACSGIIVYAYHTNDNGIYPRDDALAGYAARHGRLRGWARTDAQGRYRFETIRPGGYPGTDIPQHVHMHVIEPGRCTYYIDDIQFVDDPRLTDSQRRQSTRGRGGPGIVDPVRREDGSWRVTRDIVLGENIPGYPEAVPRR